MPLLLEDGADTATILDGRSGQTHSAGLDASAGPAEFLRPRSGAAGRRLAGGRAEIADDTAGRAGDPRRDAPAVGAGSPGTSTRP